MLKMSQHRAKANIAKDYCNLFDHIPPAPSNSDMLAHLQQSPPRASYVTPLLDALSGYARSPASLTEAQPQRAFFDRPGYGNGNRWKKSDKAELSRYNNETLPSEEPAQVSSPMEMGSVGSSPSWVDAEIPETPYEIVSPEALPSNIDPAREAQHPENWFWSQAVDRYLNGYGYVTKGKYWASQMSSLYGEEQTDARFRGNPGNWTKDCSDPSRYEVVKLGTQHWNDDVIRDHSVDTKGGSLLLGGSPLDTTGATGIGTIAKPGASSKERPGKGKYLFAMDKDGQIVVADAWGERTEHLYGPTSVLGADNSVTEKGAIELRTVNHSTLLGGMHAAAAGEMRIEDGKLVELTDTSGHYKPESFMTAQVLRELASRGIDLSGVKVQLTDPDTLEPILTTADELLTLHADFLERPDEKSAVDKRQLIKSRAALGSKQELPS